MAKMNNKTIILKIACEENNIQIERSASNPKTEIIKYWFKIMNIIFIYLKIRFCELT